MKKLIPTLLALFMMNHSIQAQSFDVLNAYWTKVEANLSAVPADRQDELKSLASYIAKSIKADGTADVMFICTHNSRRSHFGQIWANVAADYFGIKNVFTFSGGTEATAFNPNAIAAIERAGFNVKKATEGKNPIYEIYHSENYKPSFCFSKVYTDKANPVTNFMAIMTCSDAEENCPFIPGVELRIGTTYDDPKAFDNTPQQTEKYDERCKQIALETLYVFSKVN